MPQIAPAAAAPQNDSMHDMPVQTRAATLVPSTFRESDNSLEVIWTTGARRRAYDWYNDQVYEEELAVTPEAVDMTRFEAGTVQVIDSHKTYSGVSAILGIAIDGRIADGQGLARIALSTDPAKAGTVGDIKAGIIRAMSFGYSVQKYEITRAQDRTDGVNLPLYRAVLWTPAELTFCAVGADPNAHPRSEAVEHTRSQPLHGSPCQFVRASQSTTSPQEQSMPQATTAAGAATTVDTTGTAGAPDTAADDAAQRAAADATQRAADITELCARHQLGHLSATMIRSGTTLDQARAQVLDELVRRDNAAGGHTNVRIETVRDETQTRMAGMQEALFSRVDASAKLTDNGRLYRGMTLLELGRDMLESAGQSTRGLAKMELATRMLQFRSGGMHSTGDFSSLMANVASKRLRNSYEQNPGTYTRWARRAPNAPDFKSMSVVQLSAMPDLLQVNEHGEFKYGALKDGAETYGLLTYGRMVSLTRQSIINDDLRAFDRLVGAFGASAARLENRVVYAQLTANANLSDGVALFHSTHANLGSGGGSALQFSSLAAGRTAMRLQKGLAGEELNLAPASLIVPAALEQTAYQLTSSQYTPATKAEVNEFRMGGRTSVDPIVEPILDASSATAWYLAANNAQVDTVEFCYLDGAEGPVVESEVGFEVDGITFKCREDFAAKVIDFRGLYKSAGA